MRLATRFARDPASLLRRLRALAATALVTFAAGSAASAGDLVVAVHPDNSIGKIAEAQLRAIYQGARRHWPNQVAVRLVVPESGDSALKYVAGRLLDLAGPDAVSRFYMDAVFERRIRKAPSRLSGQAALEFVAKEPGAIALIDAATASSVTGVKLIRLEQPPASAAN